MTRNLNSMVIMDIENRLSEQQIPETSWHLMQKGYVIFPENSWFWVWKLNGVQTNYAYYFEDNHCRLTHSLLIPLYTKDSYCY